MSNETVFKVQMGKLGSDNSMLPLFLIAGGILLLLPRLVPDEIWLPFIFLVVPGLLLLWPAYRSTATQRSRLNFLAIPGAALLTIGLLTHFTTLTGHAAVWAYAWPLLPASLVAGARYMKRFEPDHRLHRSGYKAIRGLILLTMFLALLFELFVFRGLGAWWPLLLIGAGLYLWLRRRDQPGATEKSPIRG